MLKKEIRTALYKLFQNIEEMGKIPNLFNEAGIFLISKPKML